MIDCVVPQALAYELYDRRAEYHKDDPNVEVFIDRCGQGGSLGDHDAHADRRQRPKGSFPPIDPPAGAA